MTGWLHDLRFAGRQITRNPGFSAVAILTLTLAVGANTAVFSVVQGVLLASLPYEDGERLVFLARPGDDAAPEADVSMLDAEDLRASLTTLESFGLFMPSWSLDLTGDGDPERLTASVVEPQYFSTLRVQPLLGRVLSVDDPPDERLAVVSEGFWQRRLGGDRKALGSSLVLSERPYTVIGVVPDSTDVLEGGVELWLPVAAETPWALGERGTNNFEVIGRLAPGVSLEAAEAELNTVSTALAEEYPRTNQGKILTALPLLDVLVGPVRPALLALLAAVGLVLLLAAVNLAGLLLARGATRQREMAVRLAVGAGRARLVRQLVNEGLVLASLGGAGGVLLALWLQDFLLSRAPVSLARADAVGLDATVLVFALGITAGTGLVMSLLPAWRASRGEHGTLLRGGDAGSGARQRLQGALVVTEVALACLLLVGAGLLTRTFANLQRAELGFSPEGVITAEVVLPESRYSDPEAQSRFFTQTVDELRRLPGVEAAASVIGLPLHGGAFAVGHSFLTGDAPDVPPGEQNGARSRPVSGDFFSALRLPLLEGRVFQDTDDTDAPPVAMVNQIVADALWPDGSAVGQRVSWRLGDEPLEWMTIVGVVGNVAGATPARPDAPAIYTPYLQRRVDWQRFGQLVVRTQGDPANLGRALQEAVWRVDPAVPLNNVVPMESRLETSLARERFSAWALGIFSLAAVLLAVQGLYGLLAFSVLERRRELGIRKAVGARSFDILCRVVGRGALLASAGLAVGSALALVAGRWLESLLFGLAPTDLLTFTVSGALLLATAVLASLLPALQAARVDPMVTLRQD